MLKAIKRWWNEVPPGYIIPNGVYAGVFLVLTVPALLILVAGLILGSR